MHFTNQYIKSLEPQEKIFEVWEGGQGFIPSLKSFT